MSRVLSIVIPAYNEERFIATLIERIREVDLGRFDIAQQVIVVDDRSTDRTAEVAGRCEGVTLVRHERNQGKGRAVRTGLERATGDFVIIQDADLEYDPRDYVPMLDALINGPADIVYGSRYLAGASGDRGPGSSGGKRPGQGWAAYLGGRSLSLVARLLTGARLTDTVTALKLFRREILDGLRLVTSGFELDHEITAKVTARGLRIVEVPIRYHPRSRAEGKKIGMRDWLTAVRTFWRFRRGPCLVRKRLASPPAP